MRSRPHPSGCPNRCRPGRWSCHPRRSRRRGPRVGGRVDTVVARLYVGHLAVTDDGRLVAGRVDRGVGLGVGLVARAVGRRSRPWCLQRSSSPALVPPELALSLELPSPITVTWLSEASTGAVAPASVWLPDPLPPSPEVLSGPEDAVEPASFPPWVLPEDLLLSPTTVTWLSEASTGAVALPPVWFPDTSPLAPDVASGASAADAVVAYAMPRTVNPPAIAVAHSARRT